LQRTDILQTIFIVLVLKLFFNNNYIKEKLKKITTINFTFTMRRVFNLSKLNETIERDHATNVSFVGEKLDSKTVLNGKCSCGKEFQRRFDYCVDCGILCSSCAKNSLYKKRTTSKLVIASIPKLDLNANHFIIKIEDEEPRMISRDEILELSIDPNMLKTRITLTNDLFKVWHWDTSSLTIRCKNFINNSENVIYDAEEFAKLIPNLAHDYKFMMPIHDIVVKSNGFIKKLRIPTKFIEYPDTPVIIEPYFIGTWLGDGDADNIVLTNVDDQIINYWREYCEYEGVICHQDNDNSKIRYRAIGKVIDGKRMRNHLLFKFRDLGLIGQGNYRERVIDKHIPDIYKYNSRQVRLEIIAGLIDTDGYLNDKGLAYEFTQSRAHERLYDDLREVIKSMGWKMTKTYCIKKCYKPDGSIVDCQAIRGSISSGDDSIQDIPLKMEYKKVIKNRQARFDLSKFTIENI